MKVLITGADGQLGNEICRHKDISEDLFIFTNRSQLDITNSNLVEKFVIGKSIDVIVNCAAYTNVELSEDNQMDAYQINVQGVSNLVSAIRKNNGKIINISSDYVFNGKSSQPYDENDEADPIGIYGKTKFEGEKIINKASVDGISIRTSWLYSGFGNNFVKKIISLSKNQNEIKVVDDQFGCPTNAKDLAKAIIQIISSKKEISRVNRVYHYANEGETNWYEFAKEIIKILSINTRVIPVDSSQFKTKVKRPSYSVLSKEKIKNDFNVETPHWRNSLKCFLERYSKWKKTY